MPIIRYWWRRSAAIKLFCHSVVYKILAFTLRESTKIAATQYVNLYEYLH